MNKRKIFNKISALVIAAILVLGAAPLALAEESGIAVGQSGTISAFEPLPEETANQSVPYATDLEELSLPDMLTATVDGAEQGVSVTWDSEPDFDGYEPGEYVFTALVLGDFIVDATPPVITVTVEDAPEGEAGIK